MNQDGASGDVLFLLAHHDDEVFCTGFIDGVLRQGRRVRLLWVTAGGLAPAARRQREGGRVAELLRLRPSEHLSLGLPDQRALFFLSEIAEVLRTMLPGVTDIVVPAYEGGHPDHDAVNLVAARAGGGRAVHEFSMYRREGRGVAIKSPLLGGSSSERALRLDPQALELRRALARANSSQLPGLLLLGALAAGQSRLGMESVRRLPDHAYDRPAGGGRPLYEIYTRRRFSEFRAAAQQFAVDSKAYGMLSPTEATGDCDVSGWPGGS